MRKPPVLSAREAAELVKDGDTISVSSSSAVGCPDAVLRAIGERFDETSHPAGLTSMHCIAAGDMYGIRGVDHIAKPGLLKRILAGSLPSGPSKFDPPAIRTLIESEECEAYNIPSGSLYQLHRAIAAGQPGVFTDIGIGTYADPRIEGARMNESSPPYARIEELDGKEWIYYPAMPVNVAIIRATTADPAGNLTFEHEATTLGSLDIAYAAHNSGGIVIAQVKRLTDEKHPPREVHIPGALVDAIVVAPDQMQGTEIEFDPAISGLESRSLDGIEPLAFGAEKVIARRAAMELHRHDLVNLGFGISAGVPLVLLEEGLADDVTWVIEQGPIGGFPLTGFAFGATMNPDAIMQSTDQFTLLQGGGINTAMLSFMEVNEKGDVNVSHLPVRPHVTCGVGGFADITAHAPTIVYSGYFTAGRKEYEIGDGALTVVSDGPHAKFVPEIAQISFSGEMAKQRGQRVLYVTERAVLELIEGVLTVVEIAPGVDLERDVLGASRVPLAVSDELALMDERIFRDEPMGLALRAPRRTTVGASA